MVRAKRVVRRPKAKKVEEYDGSDPDCYENTEIPDQSIEDEIEQFHNAKISNLFAQGKQLNSDPEDEADEEEVMPLTFEDSDDEEEDEDSSNDEQEETDMESDLEGKRDDDMPNDMAWGSRKKMYYDSDYTTKKKSLEEVEAEDKEEEEEAINIQKRLVANLSEEDYDLTLFQKLSNEVEAEKAEKAAEKDHRIIKDLNTMSHKEKLKLLKKESPELLELIQDFKAKLSELQDEIQPIVQMVKDKQIPPGKGTNYLMTKQQLYLNYCTNISFYLVLKAKRIPANNHPVIERLVEYRNLINELEAVDAKLSPQLHQLLSEAPGKIAAKLTQKTQKDKHEVSKMAVMQEAEVSDSDEEAALLFYKGIEEKLKLKKKNKRLPEKGLLMEQEEEAEEETVMDSKRGITYQMAKNKGLTPKRRKIDRNPRVKHREKFRRAKIRRMGQVLEVRREERRYSGELSGIRAGVKKSIKLK